MKIYILWLRQEFELSDIPVKYFTDRTIAEAWKKEYNWQVEDEAAYYDEKATIDFYISEVEIEKTLNFDSIR